MKKTLLIVAVAMALVLAFGVTSAFAKYAGFQKPDRYQQFVDWNTATMMASANADAATQAFGPHKGYATTTIKCAVCHSAHRAENQLLSGGYGCAYCHTTSYYGGAAFAKTISWKVTSGGGPHSSCASTYCHGGPHGVGASAYAGPATKLLTNLADAELLKLQVSNGVTVGSLATYDATTRVIATAAVCQRDGCHDNSMFGVVKTGATETANVGGDANNVVTGHRVIAAASTNWNMAGGFAFTDGTTAVKTGQIAWRASSYCASCHDLIDDNNGGATAFPHAIDDVISTAQGKTAGLRSAVWLTAASYNTTGTAVSTYDDYVGGATVQTAAGSSVLDGICLKCHRGSATSGVGFDF